MLYLVGWSTRARRTKTGGSREEVKGRTFPPYVYKMYPFIIVISFTLQPTQSSVIECSSEVIGVNGRPSYSVSGNNHNITSVAREKLTIHLLFFF